MKSKANRKEHYLVSAIVSTYNSERFIRGCLRNLVKQSLYKAGQLEIIVVNSGSGENEQAVVLEFQQEYDHIVYIRTDERESIYAAWNRGIHVARGTYLTNANTDDRHRSDAVQMMAEVLERHPEIGLVYADSLITNTENETFENNSATKRYDWPDYNLGTILSTCVFGAQPLWRRKVHEVVGYFNPALEIAGDYDFFIRVAHRFGAVHLRETLGLFLQRNDSMSGRNHREQTIREIRELLRFHRQSIPLTDIYPALGSYEGDDVARRSALFDLGNLCLLSPYNDYELAKKFYDEAATLAGAEPEYFNNVGVLLYCRGYRSLGRDFLLGAMTLPAARENLRLMDECIEQEKAPVPVEFKVLQPEHPVVKQAHRARGLRLRQDGSFVETEEHQQLFWDVYSGPNGISLSENEKQRAVGNKPRVDRGDEDGSSGKREPVSEDRAAASQERTGKQGQDRGSLNILMTMYGWSDEGGGTIHPRQVATALAERGHRVTVVYTAAQTRPDKPAYFVEEQQEAGVRLFAIYNRPTLLYDLKNPERECNDAQMRRIVSQLIMEVGPDVVHFQGLVNFSMAVARDVKRAGIPSVYTAYNYWPVCPRLYLFKPDLSLCSGPSPDGSNCAACVATDDQKNGYALRAECGRQMLNEHIDRHLAVSERVRQLFVQNGHEAKKIQVLYQPSATTDRIWQQVGEKRASSGELRRPLQVGYIGSLLPQKGVHILVKAVQSMPSSEVVAHLFGAGPQSYLATLRRIDEKDRVRFHGGYDLNDLPALLRKVDVVVVPSVWEDCAPFVVQEALAARCPVIGSRIGGIPEFVQEGVSGFTFEPGNAVELANILRKFVDDRTLLGKMQRNIRAPKAWSTYLDELVAHYEELLSRGVSQPSTRTSEQPDSMALPDDLVVRDMDTDLTNQTNGIHSMRQKYSLYHVEGRQETLKQWLAPYADAFCHCKKVLDVGCGPGLFLELLKERGVTGVGLDYDLDMVTICGEKGLQARHGDDQALSEYHREFDGIHLGHVIEHLDGPTMIRMLENCVSALRPGGLLLIRTPNWQNEIVRNGGFWLDHTHVRPYPIQLLERVYADLGLEIMQKGFEPNGWNDTYILGMKPVTVQNSQKSQDQGSRSFSIRWEGPLFVYHSLALVNRELCLQLLHSGHALSIIPCEAAQFTPDVDARFHELGTRVNAPLPEPVDVRVRHQWPPNLQPPAEGHWVIIQPWEFGSLPTKWVEVFSSQVDEMWVPSHYVRQVYIDSGIPEERVFVVPNGINPEKFHPEVKPYRLRTSKCFKFLFVGGTIPRKGIDILLDVYCETFSRSDDVCLVIKDIGSDSFYKGNTIGKKIRRLQQQKNAPRISYITKLLSEEQMAGLYKACDVLVHPYRGEGFGLPILEAMGCGLPAIVTNGGACLDFCNDEVSLLVKAQQKKWAEKRVGDFETVDHPWFNEVDPDHLKEKMLEAFKNPDRMKLMGEKAQQHVHGNWTWERAARIIEERIGHLRKKPIRRFDTGEAPLIHSSFASKTARHVSCTESNGLQGGAFPRSKKDTRNLFREAKMLIDGGEMASGLQKLSQLLEIDPTHFETLQLMGDLYQELGHEAEAQQMWELAGSQHPNNPNG